MLEGQSITKGQRQPAWSDQINSPQVQAYIAKNRRTAMGFAWVLFFLFPLGFFVASQFVRDLPWDQALLIGFALGAMMLVIGFFRLRNMKKPGWDGVVNEKFQKERREQKSDDDFSTYTEYTVRIKTDGKKRKKIVEKDYNRKMYDYFAVGDRIRYHPALSTYEKYDTTRDSIIYCNVCLVKNNIENKVCTKCGCPLFK